MVWYGMVWYVWHTHTRTLHLLYPFHSISLIFHEFQTFLPSALYGASGCGPGPSFRPSGARPQSPGPTDAAPRSRRNAPPTSWGAPAGKLSQLEMVSPRPNAVLLEKISGIQETKSGFNEQTERFHPEGHFKRLNYQIYQWGWNTIKHVFFSCVFTKNGGCNQHQWNMFIGASWPCLGFWPYPVGYNFETGRGVVEPTNEVGFNHDITKQHRNKVPKGCGFRWFHQIMGNQGICNATKCEGNSI